MNFTVRVRKRAAHTLSARLTLYDEGHPRDLWLLGRIESLIHGTDGVVYVGVMSKGGHPKLLRKHIYPLEVRCEPTTLPALTPMRM